MDGKDEKEGGTPRAGNWSQADKILLLCKLQSFRILGNPYFSECYVF